MKKKLRSMLRIVFGRTAFMILFVISLGQHGVLPDFLCGAPFARCVDLRLYL